MNTISSLIHSLKTWINQSELGDRNHCGSTCDCPSSRPAPAPGCPEGVGCAGRASGLPACASGRTDTQQPIWDTGSQSAKLKTVLAKPVRSVTTRQLVQLGLVSLQTRKNLNRLNVTSSLFRFFLGVCTVGGGRFCSLHPSISHQLPHLMTSRTPGDGETTVEVV